MRRISLLYRLGLVLLLLLLAQPPAPVQADIGPKPGMDFEFEFQGEKQAILGGELLECEKEDCSDGEPLRQVGPQHFTCTETECNSTAYGYKPYHKLVIQFSDRTRQSNVFTKRGSSASFKVTVRPDDLWVEEVTSPLDPLGCFNGALGTLAVEVLVAGLYLGLFQLPRFLAGWAAVGSMLTLPFVWLFFPLLPLAPVLSTGLGEGFAVLAEAGLFYLAAGRRLSFLQVLLLSLVTNSASFLLGVVL